MELDETLLDEINRYLSGKMKADEEQRFIARLDIDEELRQEVELHHEIKNAVKLNHQIEQDMAKFRAIHNNLMAKGKLWTPEKDIVEAPEEVHAQTPDMAPTPILPQKGVPIEIDLVEQPKPEKPTRRIGLPYYVMAASIAVVLGVFGYWMYQRTNVPGPGKEIANQNQKPPVSSEVNSPEKNTKPTQFSASQNPTPQLPHEQGPQLASQGAKLFDDYFDTAMRRPSEAAIPDDRLTGPRTTPDAIDRIPQDTLAIQQAIRQLKKGNTTKAIQLLEPTTDCVLLEWQANARWYLALAYLKENQPEKAHPLLEQLSRKQTTLYQAEAAAILKALDEKK